LIWINTFPLADMFYLGVGGLSQIKVVLHAGDYGIYDEIKKSSLVSLFIRLERGEINGDLGENVIQ